MYKNDRYALRNFFSGLYIGFIEIFGILLFFGAMAAIVSLISYSPDDPSLNTAIDGSPSNLLSLAGSYYSDLMIQLFGASSYLFSAILLSFGYQLMKYHVVPFFRVLSCFIACVSTAFMAAVCDVKWFGPGVVGNFLARAARTKIDLSIGANFWILVGIMAFIFATTVILAVRLNFSRLKEFGKSFLSDGGDFFDDALEIADSLESLETSESPLARKRIMGAKADHSKANHGDTFVLPPISMLKEAVSRGEKLSESELKARSNNLLAVLNDFGIKGEITGVSPGPVVTLYELKPAAGIKSSRVIGLSSDIARYMSAVSARVAVIPGKNALGIELPNVKRQTVYLREILESDVYGKSPATLPISLGKDISGEAIVADLARMPHLLIAGTTGSGKSVGINAMILSILYKLSPNECKFIMIDPKMLELSVYDDIPHLLTPVVTDPKKAVVALKWAVREMESRYMAMSKIGVRNIDGYNAKLESLKNSGESIARRIHTGFDQETGAPIYETQTVQMEPIPYIIIIVDEMADLMLVAGKDIEVAVQRLAQMARAAGIHLVMATQRPSVDVITGTIKANFPTRISFQVSSKIDSRTILGEQGAEQLLGQGDMLYMASGGRMVRIHCPFVSDGEVEKVTENLKAQGEPHYISTILEEDDSEMGDDSSEDSLSGDDPLYNEAVSLILREGKASTSFIQRHLKIGYNRAARIIDMMETAGIVSQPNHVGKREILGR
ncbi:MAG: DNA translocase FtsK 4TM domain-containing protein [Holosporaceae bacterium]|jgi:S-DNA-T family DNA segregation ATPase FtsK/SpoIIIE|nr:DNA translocase FtsK 4TM domain-containing protein [Holosporaceae bacterium]